MFFRKIAFRVLRVVPLAGGLALLVVSLHKMTDTGEFAEILASQGVFPSQGVEVVAWIIACIEFIVGFAAVALVLRDFPQRASLLIAGLLSLIATYAVLVWLGTPVTVGGCGCGFRGELVVHWKKIAMQTSLAALAFLVLSLAISRLSRDGGGTVPEVAT